MAVILAGTADRSVSTPKPWVTVGVDVGKQRDPATIAVTTAERHATPTGRSTVLWIVRSLERLPLGTDYPKVADRIRDIIFALRERHTKPRFTYIDATGVGAAICDMLVERRVEHVPCTFVGGEKRTEHYAIPGKGVYISGLAALSASRSARSTPSVGSLPSWTTTACWLTRARSGGSYARSCCHSR